MPMIFSLYYLSRKVQEWLFRINDWLLYLGVALILWSALDLRAGYDGLIRALERMDMETAIGLIIVILISVTRFVMWLCLRRWESAQLVDGARTKSTSTTLDVKTVDKSESVENLAEFASSVFPQGPFSTKDIGDKQNAYERWHAAAPGFAKLIHTIASPQKVVGFSIVLPLKKDVYMAYRKGKVEPWSWGSEAIDGAGVEKEAYLYFQAIYCYPKYGKGEGGYLTHIVREHVKELAKDRKPVIIAPRKSKSGQANMRCLGFEGVRNSYMNFPLFELDTRRLDELGDDAGKFAKGLVP